MKPCKTCPFLVSSKLGYWHPSHLVATSYLPSCEVPDRTMGCHQWNGSDPLLKPENSPPCGGWVRVMRDHPMVRLLVFTGKVTEDELHDGFPGLYPSVSHMVRWNGIDVDSLPPLTFPYESGVGYDEYSRSVTSLGTAIRLEPELARSYVIPGSPLDQDLSGPALEAWIAKCDEWAKSRSEASR